MVDIHRPLESRLTAKQGDIMEIRSLKYRLATVCDEAGQPARRLCLAENDYPHQGFFSLCLEKVGVARTQLGWPSSTADALDNFVNSHLASVLVFGLEPPPEVMARIAAGPIVVYQYLDRCDRRRLRFTTALDYARASLWLHGLRLLGRQRLTYRQVHSLGYDCYLFAAYTLLTLDSDAQMLTELAGNFERYSDVLNQAAVELGFVETVPPTLLT